MVITEEPDHDLVHNPRVRVDPVTHLREDDVGPLAEQEQNDRTGARE